MFRPTSAQAEVFARLQGTSVGLLLREAIDTERDDLVRKLENSDGEQTHRLQGWLGALRWVDELLFIPHRNETPP